MTRLCVPITVESHEQALSDATQAAEHEADTVEYRVDTFTDLDDVRFLVEKSPLPCIVTCRPTWEGGASDLPDQERIPVLEAASLAGAAYIDVELVAYQRSANLRQKVHFNAGTPIDQTAPRPDRRGLIVSSHDFQSRPNRLNNILADLGATGANVSKIVWMARSVRDNLEAFEILRNRTRPTIALCMGEAGALSRILAPKFGGYLTFASLRDASATAPGQLTLKELLHTYRFRSIRADTAVYGVVGHPVSHSLSPLVHNAAFATAGINAVYVPLPVAPSFEAFKAFMESFLAEPALHLRGLSVTLPHKENAFRYLSERGGDISPAAARIGALNTVRIDIDGSLSGTSTDGDAILAAVAAGRARIPNAPGGYHAAVIGAGGTGRTAVAALTARGTGTRGTGGSGDSYRVTVYNRTLDRAQQLAREFSTPETLVFARSLDDLPSASVDVYIQTTSVGMAPDTLASAWGASLPVLTPHTVVFDSVYTPRQTRFLTQAADAGAITVEGLDMFAHQAAAQFEFWTGHALAASHFRATAMTRLAS